jgi:hypothetical protein
MSVTGILVNRLRRIVDRYDDKNGLRKRTVFTCTNMERRNEYRREDFRISLEEAQCPVYLDNRCCGGCDLSSTCQFAVDCNCYGYTKGALGGTDEGYYMRNHDSAKYGRIGEDGKFDWDFYKLNQTKERLVPGKFIVVKGLKRSPINQEIVEYLKEHATIIGNIQRELQEDGLLAVEFELNGEEKTLEVMIHFEDIQYGLAYENKNRII